MKHTRHTLPRVRGLSVCALLALSSACVLQDPAGDYPFLPRVSINDEDGGVNSRNNGVDMPPVDPPRLIFTEILIDAPGEDSTFTELGEYIEIKNIGDGPADPRSITMFLNDLNNPLVGERIEVATAFTPEEVAVVDGLQMLQPEDYFVFVRYETPEVDITGTVAEGYVYDFGRYANGPTLPHQTTSRRRLTIGYRYPNGDSDLFDTLEWEGHELLDTFTEPEDQATAKPTPFAEGEALGVDNNWETMSGTDDPENWCVPDETIGGESGTVSGTPGRATMCP